VLIITADECRILLYFAVICDSPSGHGVIKYPENFKL